MKGSYIIAVSIVLALIVGGVVAKNILDSSSAVPNREIRAKRAEMQLIDLINSYRLKHHLHALKLSHKLQAAAEEHSADMLARGYFDHRGFPRRVLRHRNVSFVGENIAWGTAGFGEPKGVLSLWRSSPPHKALMLTPKFRRIGIGVVIGTFFSTDNAVITTADFSN